MIIGEKDYERLPPHLQALFVKLPNEGAAEVLAAFPDVGISSGGKGEATRNSAPGKNGIYSNFAPCDRANAGGLGDAGSAARFFASFPADEDARRFWYGSKADADDRLGSSHPTVKPIGLMQWLVRLVTPRGGLVLDPFAGTGTTGEAAWREGMRAILIEREPEYLADIARRLELAANPTKRAAVAKTKNNLERPEDLPLFSSEVAE